MTSTLGTPAPTQAVRSRQPGWRDPRLWLGVAIVAVSVLAGARLLARADDTVPVWAVTADHAPGDTLTEADLTAIRVRFDSDADLERYLGASQALPSDTHLVRALDAGELVPLSALDADDGDPLLSVPLALPALGVPPGLDAGSRVDVWVTAESRSGRVVARPVLRDVVILAAPVAADGFGATGDRQLVLGVDPTQEEALGRVLAAAGDAAITVVGRD